MKAADITYRQFTSEYTQVFLEMQHEWVDERITLGIVPDTEDDIAQYIETVVWMTPILPFINDTEENLRGLLDYCFCAGVGAIISFGFGVTLRAGDRECFYKALDRHFPGLRQRYIDRYGNSYRCQSDNAAALSSIFAEECRARSIMYNAGEIFAHMKKFPEQEFGQISIFG